LDFTRVSEKNPKRAGERYDQAEIEQSQTDCLKEFVCGWRCRAWFDWGELARGLTPASRRCRPLRGLAFDLAARTPDLRPGCAYAAAARLCFMS